MSDYYLEDGTPLTEEDAHDLYDDMLDETHEDMVIGYLTFSASQVLKECDPIAYRCGFNDYESTMIEDEEWFEEDPTEDVAECDTCGTELDTDDEDQMSELQCADHLTDWDQYWEQYWADFDNGKIKEEDRKDDMFRN